MTLKHQQPSKQPKHDASISSTLSSHTLLNTSNGGFTFSKAKRDERKSLPSSPGPIYSGHDVHNNIVTRSLSIPKAPRSSIIEQVTSVSPGPAAGYDVTPKTKNLAIAFNKSKRFAEDEIKLKQTRITPGPGFYTPSVTDTSSGSPSFTFGSKVENDKRFFSDEMDFRGPCQESPGPLYDVTSSLRKLDHPPTVSFTKGTRSCDFSIMPVMHDQKPSPGDHEIPSHIGKETPSFSFGTSTREVHVIRNNEFAANMGGVDSPGPKYHPDVSKIKDTHVNVVFGKVERSQLSTPKRFISPKLAQAENYGRHSPGPASYSPKKDSTSPRITIKGREKEIVDTVYPQARRPRYLSKELASENQGQWSPGPKYSFSSTLSGPSFSFAVPDDHTRTKSNAPRNDYEKMYIGPKMPQPMPISPGPKYYIRNNLTKDSKAFTIPRAGAHDEKNKRNVDEVPGPGHYGSPDISQIQKISSSHDRGTMGKPRSKSTPRLNFGTLGKDSPGPVYSFDLDSLAKKKRFPSSWGGLS